MAKSRSPHVVSFSWNSLLSDVPHRVWTVFLAIIVTISILTIYGKFSSPRYTSSAVIAVSINSNDLGAYANLSSASAVAEQYAFVFEETSVRQHTCKYLQLASFPGTIKSEAVANLNLITLEVSANDPELAQQLLTGVLTVSPNIFSSVFSNASFELIHGPTFDNQQTNGVPKIFYILFPVAAGLLQLCVLILLSMLKPSIHDEHTFEQILSVSPAVIFHSSDSEHSCCHEDVRRLSALVETYHRQSHKNTFAFTGPVSEEILSLVLAELCSILVKRGYHTVLSEHLSVDTLDIRSVPFDGSKESMDRLKDADHVFFVVETDFAPASSVKEQWYTVLFCHGTDPDGVFIELHSHMKKTIYDTLRKR